MKRSRLNQSDVARLYFYAVYVVKKRRILNTFLELLFCYILFKSVYKLRALVTVDYVPRLGLAVRFLFVRSCVFVVGVNLNRQLVRRVDKLNKNREVLDIFTVSSESFSAEFSYNGL